jgi:hypothetical protein
MKIDGTKEGLNIACDVSAIAASVERISRLDGISWMNLLHSYSFVYDMCSMKRTTMMIREQANYYETT